MTGRDDQGARPGHRQPAAGRGPEPATRAITATSSPGRSASPSRCRWACGLRWPTPARRSTSCSEQRAYLQQVVHQTTHSLARFFLGGRRQLQAVQDGLAAPGRRRPAARGPAGLLRGRPDHDRPLPRRGQPVRHRRGAEAQFKTTYNISIVALEEAKGTLLAYDNIAVAEGPHPRKAYIQARDIQDAHRQLPIPPDGPMMPEQPVAARPTPTRSTPNPPPERRRRRDLPPHAGPDRPARTAADPAAAAGPGRRARRSSRRTHRAADRPGASAAPRRLGRRHDADLRRRRAALAAARPRRPTGPDRRQPGGSADATRIDPPRPPRSPAIAPTPGRGRRQDPAPPTSCRHCPSTSSCRRCPIDVGPRRPRGRRIAASRPGLADGPIPAMASPACFIADRARTKSSPSIVQFC